MSGTTVTHQDLKEMIISSLQLEDVNPEDMSNEEPLFGGKLELDSVDALELVVAIEGRYGIKIRSEDVQTEDFKSLDSLYQMIHKRLSRNTSTPWPVKLKSPSQFPAWAVSAPGVQEQRLSGGAFCLHVPASPG